MSAELTDALQMYPWPMNLSTNADPMQIRPTSVQQNINTVYKGTRDNPGGVGTRPGLDRQALSATIQIGLDSGTAPDILFAVDYWANVSSAKQARFVAVTADFRVFADNYSGAWATELTGSAVTLDSYGEGEITSSVMNEDLILGLKDSTDSIVVWEAQDTSTLRPLSSTTGFSGVISGAFFQGIARCWLTQQHQSRLFYAGDPQNPDRLYFSKAFFYNQFDVTGTNPAGFLDVFPGDGDSNGVTAIFPSLNSQELYIAKRRKLYKIITSDPNPNLWGIVRVSGEIGCVNHNTAKTLDQRDIFFESDLGVHSLLQVIAGTEILDGTLASYSITRDFREVIQGSSKGAHSAVYDPERNLYILTAKSSNASNFNLIYVFDNETKAWSTWETDAAVQFNYITTRFDKETGRTILYVCSNDGWMNEFCEKYKDDLGNNSINTQIRSALLFPQQTFLKETNFTDCYVLARATGTTDVSITYRIDSQQSQTVTSSIIALGGNTLGTTVLGPMFVLGIARGVRPIPFKLAGVGYTIEITLTQNELGKNIEFYGLIIKFQNSSETRTQQGNY